MTIWYVITKIFTFPGALTKASDIDFHYTFAGWGTIEVASENTTYTAVYSEAEHDYTSNCKVCSVCNYAGDSTRAHKVGNPTCTEDAVCEICHTVVTEAYGHLFTYDANKQTLTVLCLACTHTYDNNCDSICNLCGESRSVGGHIYDNEYDQDCNECNDIRIISNIFEVDSLYDGTTYSSLVRKTLESNGSNNYEINVEFVKQWGYIRFYYKGELITTVNTTFVNVGTWNDSAYTTKLYVDSNESEYVNAQLNFSYQSPISYKFIYDANLKTLTVECLGCMHTYDNACDKYCNKCNEQRSVGEHIYDNNCDIYCNICEESREVDEHQYDHNYDGSCNECGYESAKWLGKCPACNEWNSFYEEKIVKDKEGAFLSDKKTKSNKPTTLNSVEGKESHRTSTGVGELDRVLGGGLVKGSLVLLRRRTWNW